MVRYNQCNVERRPEISADFNKRIGLYSFETHGQSVILSEEKDVILLISVLIALLELVAREPYLFLLLQHNSKCAEIKRRQISYFLIESNSPDLTRLRSFFILLPDDLET